MSKHQKSWFDDPEWEELRRRVNQRPRPKFNSKKPRLNKAKSHRPQQSDPPPDLPRQVNITISLPDINWPRYKAKLLRFKKYQPTGRQLKIGLFGVAGLAILFGGFTFVRSLTDEKDAAVVDTVTKPAVGPDYNTLVAKGAENPEAAVKFDPANRVASFPDSIRSIPITVSQQPLPESFKANPEAELQKVAESFNATKPIYAQEVKAFSGTSSEDGSQTVIFTKKDLLIFIRAVKELDKDGLVQYIIDLK